MAVTPGSIEVTEGSGKKLDTAAVTVSSVAVHREIVSLGSPDASTPTRYVAVTAAGGLQVDGSGVTQPVSDAGGSLTVDGPLTDTELRATAVPVSAASLPLPTGAATDAKQDTGNASLSSIDGKTPALSGGKVPVTDPTALPLPTGAATAAKQPAIGTAGTASADVISVQGIAAGTPLQNNQTHLGGNSIAVNSGAASTGTQRVILATDQPVIPVKPQPGTSGGCSVASNSIQATATAIKTSAGQLYGLQIFNPNTAPIYAQLFNTATGSVTLGTTAPVLSFGVPAGGALVICLDSGIAFSTAITIAMTSTRSGAGAPTSTVDYNAEYV